MDRSSDELLRALARTVMGAEGTLRACLRKETTPLAKEKLAAIIAAIEACRESTRY